MESRNKILEAIRKNKPQGSYRADYALPAAEPEAWIDVYRASLEKNGGTFVKAIKTDQIEFLLKKQFPDTRRISSVVDSVKGTREMDGAADPHNLADVDVAVVKGVLGVAENAATWVAEADVVHRVLPFIAQNLVIILHEADIVPTLHEAYAHLDIRESNYGVFIAGPSKTADIEQSLVIGAHGARSLTVVVVGEGV
jgi:L-lactate dehydrogenase complex protein LldG